MSSKLIPRWNEYKTKEYLDLDVTLFCGQIFSFQRICECVCDFEFTHIVIEKECLCKFSVSEDFQSDADKIISKTNTIFFGHIEGSCFYFKQESFCILYLTNHSYAKSAIERFFTFDLEFKEIFKKFKEIKYNGLRILSVHPIECILSFICSSANNIKRIEKLVLFLKKKTNNFDNFEFNLNELEKGNFGYRKRYIELFLIQLKKVNKLKSENNNNLIGYNLKDSCTIDEDHLNQKVNYYIVEGNKPENEDETNDLRYLLLSFQGIGRKIADCILLTAYSCYSVVPIDVHIFRCSNQLFEKKYAKLTEKIYYQLSRMWIDKFGLYCGIAQIYFFREYVKKGRKGNTG